MDGHCINVIERRTFLEVVEDCDVNKVGCMRRRSYSDSEIKYCSEFQAAEQTCSDTDLCSTHSGGTADYESSCSWSNAGDDIADMSLPQSRQVSQDVGMVWVPVQPYQLVQPYQFVQTIAQDMTPSCPLVFDNTTYPSGVSAPFEYAPGDWQISARSESEQVHSKTVSKTTESPSAEVGPKRQPTTIIIRGICTHVTREALTNVFDMEGFSGAYDFVHVPVHFPSHDGTSLGYAIVNLTDHVMAKAFMAHFSGSELACFSTCEIKFSDAIQGLSALVERYRDSAVMHDSVPQEHQPAVYRRGRKVSFPAPTKKIRAPRIRHRKADSAV